MTLARGELNPLNVLNIRKISYIPAHFEKFYSVKLDKIQNIDHWIYTNLNSRYCIKKSFKILNNMLTEVCEIGIEDSKEITMLTLTCPYLL